MSSAITQAWYPVARSESLVGRELLAFELLGEPLVCFRDQAGGVVCLQDRCPHRSTPLSQGRVVQGRLQCRYHGWEFGAEGRCQRIPVLPAGKTAPAGANAVSRPTLERHGLIWVWPGEASEVTSFPEHLFATVDAPGMGHYIYDATIDVPHDAMVENLLDPAHVPFTHHGTLSVRSMAQPLRFQLLEDSRAVLSARVHYQRQPAMLNLLRFHAPCVVAFDVRRTEDSRLRDHQLHFCVPMARDRTRLFSVFAGNLWPGLLRLRGARALFRWLTDRATRQDVAMLKGQRKNVLRGAPHFQQAIVSDALTFRYRRWFEQQCTEDDWFKGFETRSAVLLPRVATPAG
jgi:phenylpropionate dioxygenase-like ring-hydroxylating dioxygenase large terminal subunit